MRCEKKNKEYTSMFDPWREKIEEWCDTGMPLVDVFAMLPDGYTFGGFYSYIQSQKIRYGKLAQILNSRHKCSECEYCRNFLNQFGKQNDANRICLKTMRVINAGVRHCPTWCELERERRSELRDKCKSE